MTDVLAAARPCLYLINVSGYSLFRPLPAQIKADLAAGKAPKYLCNSGCWHNEGTDVVRVFNTAVLERYEFFTIRAGLESGGSILLLPEIVMRETPEELVRQRVEQSTKVPTVPTEDQDITDSSDEAVLREEWTAYPPTVGRRPTGAQHV